jgi:hypothetical protein
MANLWRSICFLVCLLLTTPALALDPPSGDVVLTILGNITVKNDGAGASLDMAALEKLPQHDLTVQTPWYPQPVTFTGPLLRDVMSAVGASGTALKASAIDDYDVVIPFTDIQKYDVILGRKLNGKPLSVRENGPLFVMYPLDSDPALRSKLIFDRCIWQLKSIVVE